MALHYMTMEVYKCVSNVNPQHLNETFTLTKCAYGLGDNSLLESQQHDLQIMVSNLSKFMVPKYGTYSQRHIKWGCHLIH